MNTRTRDTIALFAIGSVAIVMVLFPELSLERLFEMVLARL